MSLTVLINTVLILRTGGCKKSEARARAAEERLAVVKKNAAEAKRKAAEAKKEAEDAEKNLLWVSACRRRSPVNMHIIAGCLPLLEWSAA